MKKTLLVSMVVYSIISWHVALASPDESKTQQQDQDEICKLSLMIMEFGCGYFKSCINTKSGCEKAYFSVKVEKPGAIEKGFKCENEHFQYLHPKTAPRGQQGVKIVFKILHDGYEYHFTWGKIDFGGGVAFCGHFFGKAIRSGDKWELNCGASDCLKPIDGVIKSVDNEEKNGNRDNSATPYGQIKVDIRNEEQVMPASMDGGGDTGATIPKSNVLDAGHLD